MLIKEIVIKEVSDKAGPLKEATLKITGDQLGVRISCDVLEGFVDVEVYEGQLRVVVHDDHDAEEPCAILPLYPELSVVKFVKQEPPMTEDDYEPLIRHFRD